MTLQILFGEEIRSKILYILSGACLVDRCSDYPHLFIVSPWISDVDLELSDLKLMDKLKTDKSFLIGDFNIRSINLPYALLLIKLHSGAQVNIVTLPPTRDNYSSRYLPKLRILLDFLDEIGCDVFLNSKLHTKLLLANDLAILGSCNLSKSSLYFKDEIAVSIDDLDNLHGLEQYCHDLISRSNDYGYSGSATKSWADPDKPQSYNFTRGWLLDQIFFAIYTSFGVSKIVEAYGEFLNVTGGYDSFVKSYARDLESFYNDSFRKLFSSPEGKRYITDYLRCDSKASIDSIMAFIMTRIVRKSVPRITLRMKPMTI